MFSKLPLQRTKLVKNYLSSIEIKLIVPQKADPEDSKGLPSASKRISLRRAGTHKEKSEKKMNRLARKLLKSLGEFEFEL